MAKMDNRKIANVFMYSSFQDEQFGAALAKHLSGLEREGRICLWHSGMILAGSEWSHEIKQKLEDADVILLLVSSDFIASDFPYCLEMKHALDRHEMGKVHMALVIVRPCDWKRAPFANLIIFPRNQKPVATWDDQDEALLMITQDIREIIKGNFHGKEKLTGSNSDHVDSHEIGSPSNWEYQYLTYLLCDCEELDLTPIEDTDFQQNGASRAIERPKLTDIFVDLDVKDAKRRAAENVSQALQRLGPTGLIADNGYWHEN